MRNIIFLDCDGVINNTWSFIHCPDHLQPYAIDPRCINLLDGLCTKHKIEVVVSSTWRLGGLDRIKEVFKKAGHEKFLRHLHSDWATPRSRDGVRGDEVRKWLSKHRYKKMKFLCIDDDSDFHSGQPLLRTVTELGFTHIDYRLADIFFQDDYLYKQRDLQHLQAEYKYSERVAINNQALIERERDHMLNSKTRQLMLPGLD